MTIDRKSFATMLILAFALASSASAQTGQIWDQRMDGPGRFRIIAAFENEAVLDRETGLVWERTPGNSRDNWANAFSLCYGKTLGGRHGWRLPRMDELVSLITPGFSAPPLPNSHPFELGTDLIFWTANTYAVSPFTTTYVLDFSDTGAFYIRDKAPDEDHQLRVWCVRGPGGTADGM
jgi:Protein of unknown function (DUF1566)